MRLRRQVLLRRHLGHRRAWHHSKLTLPGRFRPIVDPALPWTWLERARLLRGGGLRGVARIDHCGGSLPAASHTIVSSFTSGAASLPDARRQCLRALCAACYYGAVMDYMVLRASKTRNTDTAHLPDEGSALPEYGYAIARSNTTTAMVAVRQCFSICSCNVILEVSFWNGARRERLDESFSRLSSMIAVDSLSKGRHRITHHFPM